MARWNGRLVRGVGINDMPGWFAKGHPYYNDWVYFEWSDMLRRCYDNNALNQDPCYAGCTVCERWKTFSNFEKDVSTLPGWSNVVASGFQGYSLDKDGRVLGNKVYSPQTCQWVTTVQNTQIRNNQKGNPASSPSRGQKLSINGKEYNGFGPAARDLNICCSVLAENYHAGIKDFSSKGINVHIDW